MKIDCKEQRRQHIQYLKRKYKTELEKLKEVTPENRKIYLKRLELEEDLKQDRKRVLEHRKFLKAAFRKRGELKHIVSSA
jgi:hypothetical protein